MNTAVAAINKGMGGSFVQTATAQTLKKLVMERDGLNDGERGELVAFLSNDAEAPGGAEISGILQTMADEMSADVKTIVASEDEKVKSYGDLMSSKKKMVETLTKSIETKLKRIGKLGIDIVQMKNDLGESGESLIEDKKFLADLDKNCAEKQKLFDDNVRMRGQELLALQDTIKMLNSDDALELFKKTLPGASASFMQVKESTDRSLASASLILREALKSSEHKPSLDFILLALQGKKAGFGKVIKLIDSLVGELRHSSSMTNTRGSIAFHSSTCRRTRRKRVSVILTTSKRTSPTEKKASRRRSQSLMLWRMESALWTNPWLRPLSNARRSRPTTPILWLVTLPPWS